MKERAAAHAAGPAGYLKVINPLWHLLGRVTFHLAENKRDASRPFAFLATYTHRLSRQDRLQHLPLAEALKISCHGARQEEAGIIAGTGPQICRELWVGPRAAGDQSVLFLRSHGQSGRRTSF